VKARRVVSGDRSRRRLSSELPYSRPLLSLGDIIGDATLRGVRGGINRMGEEKPAMMMMYYARERANARTCVRTAGTKGTRLRFRKPRVAMLLLLWMLVVSIVCWPPFLRAERVRCRQLGSVECILINASFLLPWSIDSPATRPKRAKC
jgi:hypothetical protein